jgi:hypothetical protein
MPDWASEHISVGQLTPDLYLRGDVPRVSFFEREVSREVS